MIILAHRGLWRAKSEQNTLKSLLHALDSGFGVETDIRDRDGEIFISHDSPTGLEPTLRQFLMCAGKLSPGTIALNVKSDGLLSALQALAVEFQIDEALYFDLSGPEHLRFKAAGLKTLNRISEHESGYSFSQRDYGIWLDAFADDDWRIEWISERKQKSGVYVVSPELHGRPYKEFWFRLRALGVGSDLALCTDYPVEAHTFFNGGGP